MKMPDTIFNLEIFSIILWGLFLVFLYIFALNTESRSKRIIIPFLIGLVPAVVGAALTTVIVLTPTFIGGVMVIPVITGDALAVLLMVPLPTLAILTVLPVTFSTVDLRGKGVLLGIISFAYTISFFYYCWASNFGGTSMIFLSFSQAFPGYNPVAMFTVLFFNFLELTALAGIIVLFAGLFKRVLPGDLS
jgi:hypothetical protein